MWGHIARKAAQEKREEAIRVEKARVKIDNVFTLVLLKANLDKNKIHMTIQDSLKKHNIITNHELPQDFIGDLSDPDEIDDKLKEIKEKCLKLV